MARRAGADWITTIPSRCAATLILGDLHQALLSRAADGVGVTRTLLHGKGCQDDARDTELLAVLLEI